MLFSFLSSRGFRRRATVAGVLFLATGCHKQASEGSLAPVSRAVASDSDSPSSAQSLRDPSVFLAQVPAGALGPRLAFSERGAVVVWADTSGEEPGLYSMALGRDDVPFPPRRAARVDRSARQLTLGWTNGGDVLATTVHKNAGQEILTATRLSAEGVFEAGPQVLTTTPNPILYTKIVPTALGAVVVWVERAAGAADLYSIVIDEKGPRRPTRQVRDISAWQVVSHGRTTAVVTREGTESPLLMFRHLGDRGETIGAPIELARHLVGGKDVDVALNRDHILVAWSEQGAYHAQIMGTLLDASGNVVRTPFALTPPRGDQALLSLQGAANSQYFHVAWREPLEAHHGRASVFVGRLTAESPLAVPRYRLNAARVDPLLPLFATKGEDLAVLTDYSCTSTACGRPVERASAWLSARDVAPQGGHLRVDGRPPTLSWDLTCSAERCLYLMSDGMDPARVHLATLSAQGPLDGLIGASTMVESPRVVGHTTLADVPELAELHGVSFEGGARSLLSWVSYFEPEEQVVIPKGLAPDGRPDPFQARLTTVVPARPDRSGGVESIISYRARSLGGVHLVAPKDNRGLLLWSALDQKKPRLFGTLVDSSGKKLVQRMLTRTDGEVTDVTAVRVPGGYLLSWVDGTGASPRVLALRVSDALLPVGSPKVVTERAVSPNGVALLTTAEGVHCVWSDVQNGGLRDAAQLYGSVLDPATANPKGPPEPLTSGEDSAHSPQLISTSEGEPLVAWISQPNSDLARLHVGVLAAGGSSLRLATKWWKDGDVRDFSVECASPSECRAAVIVTEGEEEEAPRVSLWVLSGLAPSAQGIRETLAVPLWAPSSEGVSPVLLGDEIYYSDRAEDGSGWRLRRVTIDWSEPEKSSEKPPLN